MLVDRIDEACRLRVTLRQRPKFAQQSIFFRITIRR
jgi:hypothetical protein